ncbi:hypothetical protein, partial [Photorhabdus sp. RM125S]|uniref:hypothetical protein n=1 Tax=Photorhabdus sp. RM125S TaxID=3342821 RepID=UPI0036DE7940
ALTPISRTFSATLARHGAAIAHPSVTSLPKKLLSVTTHSSAKLTAGYRFFSGTQSIIISFSLYASIPGQQRPDATF